MKKVYKIESILHTGTRGKAGTQRHGGNSGQHYDFWTGMTVWHDSEEDTCGVKIFHYILTKKYERTNGWMHTSTVKDVVEHDNGDLEITTLNSIYKLKHICDINEDNFVLDSDVSLFSVDKSPYIVN